MLSFYRILSATVFFSVVALPGSLGAEWASGVGTISTGAKVGIGTETPQWGLHIRLDGPQQPIAWQETIGNHAGGSAILMTKARGTADARLLVENNDVIGGLFGQAWDGTGYRSAGTIRMFSDGGTSAGSTPGKIVFQTTPVGSTSLSDRLTIREDGRVGIGTSNPQSLLAVDGAITAREIEVTVDGWADFVFDDSYKLKPIPEVASFIRENRHLPDVPSKDAMAENQLNLGAFSVLLLQKVEELTLYVIDLEESNRDLSERLAALEGRWVADGSR